MHHTHIHVHSCNVESPLQFQHHILIELADVLRGPGWRLAGDLDLLLALVSSLTSSLLLLEILDLEVEILDIILLGAGHSWCLESKF